MKLLQLQTYCKCLYAMASHSVSAIRSTLLEVVKSEYVRFSGRPSTLGLDKTPRFQRLRRHSALAATSQPKIASGL